MLASYNNESWQVVTKCGKEEINNELASTAVTKCDNVIKEPQRL